MKAEDWEFKSSLKSQLHRGFKTCLEHTGDFKTSLNYTESSRPVASTWPNLKTTTTQEPQNSDSYKKKGGLVLVSDPTEAKLKSRSQVN